MMTSSYQPLQYLAGSPDIRLVREIAQLLMFHYSNINQSRHKWKAHGPLQIWFQDGQRGRRDARPFTFDELSRYIFSSRKFDSKKYELIIPGCPWLDYNIGMALSNWSGTSMKLTIPGIQQFPIEMKLDRAGRFFESPQAIIQKSLLCIHRTLLDSSDKFSTDEWFSHLKNYICECISWVDVTLHQIYNKAKYDPMPDWQIFDEQKLEEICPRHGGRLNDKLRWVHSITGSPVHFAKEEFEAFERVRCLRNHLTHWDPPNFCYTLDDVVGWLNAIQPISRMLWKIREAVAGRKDSLNEELIEMLLLPKVYYVPPPGHSKPPPLLKGWGYASSLWPPTPPKIKERTAEQKFSFKMKDEHMKALQEEANRRNSACPDSRSKVEVSDIIRELIDGLIATRGRESGQN